MSDIWLEGKEKMNREELETELKKLGVPEHQYELYGGHKDQALTLSFENPVWKVFFYERGQENVLREFRSEEAACEYFYEQFQTPWRRTVRKVTSFFRRHPRK